VKELGTGNPMFLRVRERHQRYSRQAGRLAVQRARTAPRTSSSTLDRRTVRSPAHRRYLSRRPPKWQRRTRRNGAGCERPKQLDPGTRFRTRPVDPLPAIPTIPPRDLAATVLVAPFATHRRSLGHWGAIGPPIDFAVIG
jgi:hypothetical protein